MQQTQLFQVLGAGIALLAGYLFVRLSFYRRYSTERLRADRFALHVVGYALIFLLIGTLLDKTVSEHPMLHPAMLLLRTSGVPVAVLYACLVALLAALAENSLTLLFIGKEQLIPESVRRSLAARARWAAVARYVARSKDPSLTVLYRAITLRKLLMITLKGGKVYVGVPPLELDPSEPLISMHLVPFASGFRDRETKSVSFVTRYAELMAGLQPEGRDSKRTAKPYDPLYRDYALLRLNGDRSRRVDIQDIGVVVTWSEVESLMIFDPNLFRAFEEADGALLVSSPL